MTPSKPYLIRAIYEWITDNNLTPYIAVDTNIARTMVPREYISEGRIVLDISPTATSSLIINNDSLECKARFGGISHTLYIPIAAIMVIYAQENNQGMAFPPEEYDNIDDIEKYNLSNQTNSVKKHPHLKFVTDELDDNNN